MTTPLEVMTFEPAAPDRRVGSARVTPWATIGTALTRVVADGSWASNAPLRSASLTRWAAAIDERATEIADVIAREVGKPIVEANAEVVRSVAIIRYYAQATYDPIGVELPPGTPSILRLFVEHRPVGAILAVCPWNFPLAIPIWKMAPALAYGNQVVLRPSSYAVAVARCIAETAAATLPDGAVHVWHGPSTAVSEAIADPLIAAVTFTGSVPVGRQIVRAATDQGKPVQAEMGGQNAAIVLADASIDHAADTIVAASMAFAGQKCTATRRVIVHRDIARQLVDALVDRVSRLEVGDPLDPATVVGPMISAAARSKATAALAGIPRRRLLVGGASFDPGWFLNPTLVRVDRPSDPLAQEELFAPVATILVADDDNEAVMIANSTRFGLVGAVYGRDIERATAVAGALTCGLVRVNAATTGVDFHAPFGGDGASSYGPREQGRAIRGFVTRTRTISIARP